MGQAKKRGTFEQRRAERIINNGIELLNKKKIEDEDKRLEAEKLANMSEEERLKFIENKKLKHKLMTALTVLSGLAAK